MTKKAEEEKPNRNSAEEIDGLLTELLREGAAAEHYDRQGHAPELAASLQKISTIRRRILQRVGDLALLAGQWHRLAVRAGERAGGA